VGYEASSWTGRAAPRNMPAEAVEKLNREINVGLADAKVKARGLPSWATSQC
jgi:tripartite-type tricarboxylate transporter receptor subunit TctC